MAFILRKFAGHPVFFLCGRTLLRSHPAILPVCQLNITTSCRKRLQVPKEQTAVSKLKDVRRHAKDESSTGYTDKLFGSVNSKEFSVAQAASILFKLSELTDKRLVSVKSYATDPRFDNLCKNLVETVSTIPTNEVMGILRSLLTMGINPESKIIQNFENELLWRMRRMNFKTLSICFNFHHRHKETELQMHVYTELVNALQTRWVEIADAEDVIKNLTKASCFDQQFLLRVEERALSVADKMTVEELHKLCIALANCQHRPTSLLRSISYHFTRKSEKLKAKQTINMLHSLNTLNFADQAILQKLSSDILPDVSTMNGKNIASLLTTIGQLKWRHPALLDACCDWMLTNSDSCGAQEIVSCILTLAALNYQPDDEDKLFAILLPKLNRKLINIDTIWLDVVLSLAILGRATPDHLASVLNPSFYRPLCEAVNTSTSATFQDTNIICKLKVLNVNAAKLEIPHSKISVELGNAFNHVQVLMSKHVKLSQETVITALSHFLPQGKFMATNLHTALGLLIDAEFIMDKNGKPVSLVQYGIRAGCDKDLKPLPAGWNRVALLIWHFKDFTSNTTSLVGKNAFAVRLLTKIGYKVVQINYSEFQEHTTVVKTVQYLQETIKDKLREGFQEVAK